VSLAGLPLVAAVAALVRWPPAFVEQTYTNGVYPHVQPVLTSLTNLVPFAWLDLLAGIAILATAARLIVTWRKRSRVAAWVGGRLAGAVRLAAIVYLAFLATWGCNYQRAPARERFAVADARVTPERLRALATRAVDEVNELYDAGNRASLDWTSVQTRLAPAFRAATRETGTRWSVVPGRPKGGLVARTFPWSAVDGMINPLGLEVLVNPEVLPFERPFVLAHEWAHLAGHADESEASFVGFLACLAGTRDARYSGWLTLLLHAGRAVPAGDRAPVLGRLGEGPRRDVAAIHSRLAHARPTVHAVSWRVYDEYLKANGVEAGVASYDEVVQLILGSGLTARLASRDSGSPPVANPGSAP
jgi:hypothetical protein